MKPKHLSGAAKRKIKLQEKQNILQTIKN